MLCMQLTRKERKKGLFSLLRPLKPTNYKQIEGLSFCVLLFLIWLLSFTAKNLLLCIQKATHMQFSSKSISKEPDFKKMCHKLSIIASEITFFLCFGILFDTLWGTEMFDWMIFPLSESILGYSEAKLPQTSLQTNSANCTSPFFTQGVI